MYRRNNQWKYNQQPTYDPSSFLKKDQLPRPIQETDEILDRLIQMGFALNDSSKLKNEVLGRGVSRRQLLALLDHCGTDKDLFKLKLAMFLA